VPIHLAAFASRRPIAATQRPELPQILVRESIWYTLVGVVHDDETLWPPSHAAPRSGRAGANGNGHPLPAHRLTLNLTNAESFANMLAKSRAARVVEAADMLAGMYTCDWERLSQYQPKAE